MSAERLTNPERTAAILQLASRDGVRVMIPGGFDPRGRSSSAGSPNGVPQPVSAPAPAAAESSRQIERERQEGGAPGQPTIKGDHMTTGRVDLPSVHMAGSDAHHAAHIEVGPHGFALFLSPDADYPVLDVNGTREQLDAVVRGLEAALASRP